MIHQFLKPSILRRSALSASSHCRQPNTTAVSLSKKIFFNNNVISTRSFQTTQPSRVPILPIPAIILGALKTGKLVSVVSLSSKTSLTLLPHTFRRGGRGDKIAKLLVGIPVIGFTLLLLVGLDQAPNTSRLRLVYLSEEEERELLDGETSKILDAQYGLVAEKDNGVVVWLQTIVDNLAAAAVDDIRDPVRYYGNQKGKQIQDVATSPTDGEVDSMAPTQEEEEGVFQPPAEHRFDVDVICDSSTLNAMCVGSHIIVYDLMLYYMEYDTARMAVILSHEIAHSIQRHTVEQLGFASFMLMLGDITRGALWMFTESLGPYVNEKINEYISTLIDLEKDTTYNRKMEKEADLVGLKILAKAGYDPRIAIEVWERMAELDSVIEEGATEPENIDETLDKALAAAERSVPAELEVIQQDKSEDLEKGVREFLDSLVTSWFGLSHPPSLERVEYMREHMDEAILLYNESLKINGPPIEFILNKDEELELTDSSWQKILGHISRWLAAPVYALTGGGELNNDEKATINTQLLKRRPAQH